MGMPTLNKQSTLLYTLIDVHHSVHFSPKKFVNGCKEYDGLFWIET